MICLEVLRRGTCHCTTGQNVRSWTFKVAKKPNKEIQHNVCHDVSRLDPKWLREAIYHYLMKIITKNTLRSSKITDQIWFHAQMISIALPFWFKSFRRPQPSNIMQHTSFVRFLRGRFSCSTPWQLSLTLLRNGLNRHGRITSCFSKVLSSGFHNLLATLPETPCFLAMRLLHPTFRPRTIFSHTFEWLKTILVGILVGHNLVLKVAKRCNTMSPEFFKN